jgi:peptide/nickel transport system permease protein
MSRYLIRRLIGSVLVMWAVATLVFFMLRIVPGDPIAAMLFDAGDAAAVEALRHKLGLDAPIYVQYVKWFWLMLHGDLGSSIYGSHVPVSQAIAVAIPRTLSIASHGI